MEQMIQKVGRFIRQQNLLEQGDQEMCIRDRGRDVGDTRMSREMGGES